MSLKSLKGAESWIIALISSKWLHLSEILQLLYVPPHNPAALLPPSPSTAAPSPPVLIIPCARWYISVARRLDRCVCVCAVCGT